MRSVVLTRTEGIIPAVGSSHAVAQAMELIPGMSKDDIVVITISGRGDKDVKSVARFMGVDIND